MKPTTSHLPFFVLASLQVLMMLSGCRGSSIKSPEEVRGRYILVYPSGQVEELFMRIDHTFTQMYYTDTAAYRNRATPQFTNVGSWSSYQNAFRFEDYLSICALSDPARLLRYPEKVNQSDVYWIAPNGKHNGAISIYWENGYVLKRVADTTATP